MYVSDEYRASQQNAPAWFFILLWLVWVALNIAGFVLGQWLADSIGSTILGGSSTGRALSIEGNVQIAGVEGYFVAILQGIIAGIVLAIAQSILLFAFLKKTGITEWVVATAIGRTVQWLIFYIVGIEMVGITFDKELPNVALLIAILVVTGILGGIALGYIQSQVFRSRANRSGLWIMVNILGPAITAFVVGMTLFVESQNTTRDYSIVLVAVIGSIATGIALMDLLHHPRPEAEWTEMLTWDRDEPEETGEETELGSSFYRRKS